MLPLPLFLLPLAVLVLPLAEGTECTRSSDCPASSPYCSKWGYCQWSPRYGQSGPEDGQDCRTDGDCRGGAVCRAGHCRVTSHLRSCRSTSSPCFREQPAQPVGLKTIFLQHCEPWLALMITTSIIITRASKLGNVERNKERSPHDTRLMPSSQGQPPPPPPPQPGDRDLLRMSLPAPVWQVKAV